MPSLSCFKNKVWIYLIFFLKPINPFIKHVDGSHKHFLHLAIDHDLLIIVGHEIIEILGNCLCILHLVLRIIGKLD